MREDEILQGMGPLEYVRRFGFYFKHNRKPLEDCS
jgi:hypothetical protein